MRAMKQEILPLVHAILEDRYGPLTPIVGQGITKGERVEFTMDGRRARAVIKTSTGGRISFGRRDGKWSGLDDSDYVVIVAPAAFHNDEQVVSLFDRQTLKEVFDTNQAAQERAGMGGLPNWIAPFHEEGRRARGTGDGFGSKALWSEPLSPSTATPTPGVAARVKRPSPRRRGITINEAKKLLSESLGVPIDAIEIIVRA